MNVQNKCDELLESMTRYILRLLDIWREKKCCDYQSNRSRRRFEMRMRIGGRGRKIERERVYLLLCVITG